MIKKYWNLRIDPIDNHNNKLLQNFEDLIRGATERRMISDVPLRAYLSRGLDSSLITSFMADNSNEPINTFSVGFDDKRYSELDKAQIVSKKIISQHHELQTDTDNFNLLKKIVWHLDEPLGDAAVLPVYQLSKFAKKFVTVVLSGDVSDELLGGYDKYRKIPRMEVIRNYFPSVVEKVMRKLVKSITSDRILSYLSQKNSTLAYMELTGVFSQIEKGARK